MVANTKNHLRMWNVWFPPLIMVYTISVARLLVRSYKLYLCIHFWSSNCSIASHVSYHINKLFVPIVAANFAHLFIRRIKNMCRAQPRAPHKKKDLTMLGRMHLFCFGRMSLSTIYVQELLVLVPLVGLW